MDRLLPHFFVLLLRLLLLNRLECRFLLFLGLLNLHSKFLLLLLRAVLWPLQHAHTRGWLVEVRLLKLAPKLFKLFFPHLHDPFLKQDCRLVNGFALGIVFLGILEHKAHVTKHLRRRGVSHIRGWRLGVGRRRTILVHLCRAGFRLLPCLFVVLKTLLDRAEVHGTHDGLVVMGVLLVLVQSSIMPDDPRVHLFEKFGRLISELRRNFLPCIDAVEHFSRLPHLNRQRVLRRHLRHTTLRCGAHQATGTGTGTAQARPGDLRALDDVLLPLGHIHRRGLIRAFPVHTLVQKIVFARFAVVVQHNKHVSHRPILLHGAREHALRPWVFRNGILRRRSFAAQRLVRIPFGLSCEVPLVHHKPSHLDALALELLALELLRLLRFPRSLVRRALRGGGPRCYPARSFVSRKAGFPFRLLLLHAPVLFQHSALRRVHGVLKLVYDPIPFSLQSVLVEKRWRTAQRAEHTVAHLANCRFRTRERVRSALIAEKRIDLGLKPRARLLRFLSVLNPRGIQGSLWSPPRGHRVLHEPARDVRHGKARAISGIASDLHRGRVCGKDQTCEQAKGASRLLLPLVRRRDRIVARRLRFWAADLHAPRFVLELRVRGVMFLGK